MQTLHQPAAQGREPKGGNQERQHNTAPATQDRNVSTATMRIRARTKGAAMIFKIVRIVHTSYKKFVVCLYMYIITPQEGANKDASAIPTSGQNVQKSR